MTALKVISECTRWYFSAFFKVVRSRVFCREVSMTLKLRGSSKLELFLQKISIPPSFWQRARGTLHKDPRTFLTAHGFLFCWTRFETRSGTRFRILNEKKDHNLTFKWRARLFNLIFRLSLRDLSWVIISIFLIKFILIKQFSRFFIY